MLETVKKQIEDLPDISFEEYYQKYVFSIQDENIYSTTSFSDITFFNLDKILGKIRRELGIVK